AHAPGNRAHHDHGRHCGHSHQLAARTDRLCPLRRHQDAAADLTGVRTMAKRWYVVHAYSGFEPQVAKTLKERIVRAGMEDRFGEVLVPTEEVVEMRGGQKRKSQRKFFPGYVLVQIETSGDGGG